MDHEEDILDDAIPKQEYIDSIIFVIDGSAKMHDNNYVMDSLKTYRNIVAEKCAANKKDKIGLFMYGLNSSNCDIENCYCLQTFSTITVEFLKNINVIINSGLDKYKQLASSTHYPLFDILAYASQTLHKSKKNPSGRSIIVLCTNNDNPNLHNVSENQRLLNLVSGFKEINIEFKVVGLSSCWNDNFFKGLQLASGSFKHCNYKRVCLSDFEDSIIYPARSVSKIPWKISPNLSIEVAIINLISPSVLSSRVKLDKRTNEQVSTHRIQQRENIEETEDTFKNVDNHRLVENDNIAFYKHYGGVKIYFEPPEMTVLKTLGLEPVIEILGFTKIQCDPLYFQSPAYLVTNTGSNLEGSKLFFAMLIRKCAEKNRMIICKVVTKLKIFICYMIPSEADHGFFMIKIPWSGCVRNFEDKLKKFIYSKEEKNFPSNQDVVKMMHKFIDATTVDFNIKHFKNPKLEKRIAHIKALALEENLDLVPSDSTVPPVSKYPVESIISDIEKICGFSKKKLNTEPSTVVKRKKYNKKT